MDQTCASAEAVQQSMDIDSSPVASRQQDTCNTGHQLNTSTMEFQGDAQPTVATVSKKCTCPYERPTLKTMEANIINNNNNSKHQQLPASPRQSSSESDRARSEEEEDTRNANLIRPSVNRDQVIEDNLNNNNNNNSSSSSVNSMACDNEVSLLPSDVKSSNPSIMLNVTSNSSSHSSLVLGDVVKVEEIVQGKEDKKTTTKHKKTSELLDQKLKKSKKKAAGGEDKCRCSSSSADGVTVRVKAAESPPVQSLRMSLNDGILSNCLSALNFVSGNRIGGGGGDSKSATGGSPSSAAKGSRASKSGKSSSSSGDSLDSRSQLCGENCSRKEIAQPPPTKLCKTCRGHGMTKSGSSSSSSSSSTGDEREAAVAGDPVAVTPSKTKRSPWALRFNCARLKVTKSASSSSSPVAVVPPTTSTSVKETVCKCSSESTTKASSSEVSSTVTTKSKTTKKKKKSSTNNNNALEQPSASSSTDLISGATIAGSCSRVTTAPVGTPSITSSSELNCGGVAIMVVPGSTKAVLNPTSGSAAGALQDNSRLSFTSLSTEDCDEWARMQREKEIEDGVEAPPGYLPKFQFNKMTSGSAANQTGSNTSTSQSGAAPTAVTVAPQGNATLQQLGGGGGGTVPIPSLGGLSSSQWPHVICAPPDWQQLPQFCMQPGRMISCELGRPRTTNPVPKVHSQVDFIHCLVPDLQRITSCGFYWGKMDRYQAETLLDGKPEGTFLLRDSAQEEFLFSVSFRKYGRSLHARIEQFNHKFSFDSHDPGVYTANTVTGLLEHYKDPSCVMFFEPMLTQPLNRNFCFSLQQLCRATIVSETTYDNIGDLKLPHLMKGYLKEYHYKQKVRVKMFDELRAT